MVKPDAEAGPQLALAGLGARFAQEQLRSSARILILLALGVNQRLTFSDLLELTHVAKGSLSYHLKQLETAGLLHSATVFTFNGQRVAVTITSKGQELYGYLVEELRRLPPLEDTWPAASERRS